MGKSESFFQELASRVGPTIQWDRQKSRVQIFQLVNDLLMSSGLKKPIRDLYYNWNDYRNRGVLEKNLQLSGKYHGSRIFIFGTAPSLIEVDLPLLKDEFTFALNFMYEHPHLKTIDLSFYIENEPLWSFPFMGIKPTDYYRAIDRNCLESETVFFLRSSSRGFFKKHRIFEGRQVYYIDSSSRSKQPQEVSGDLSKPIGFANGAMMLSIIVSIYMGFKELFVCGWGYSYKPNLCLNFFDSPFFSKRMDVKERDHVIKEFLDFRSKQIAGLRLYRMVEYGENYIPFFAVDAEPHKSHYDINRFAQKNGVKIYNIVPDGFESPVYEKLSWDSVVGAVL